MHEVAQAASIESAFDRFREQTFFFEECLDLVRAVQGDPDQHWEFERRGYRHAWLDDAIHQLEVLEKITGVLLNWEAISPDQPS